MEQLPKGLMPLADYNQFIIWKLVPDTPKARKVPINVATMNPHDPHDRSGWMDAQAAIDTANVLGDEYDIGFVFTKEDPFWFLDIDGCVEPTAMTPIAEQMMTVFSGAAIEISQSGQGLHIFGTGDCPVHGTRDTPNGMEFYTELRFVALTGNMLNDEPCNTDCSLLMPWLVDTHFTPVAEGTVNPANWTTGPVPEWKGPTDDDILIDKACATVGAVAAFSGKATFNDLFKGGLGEGYDASQADASLASRLAFWTGKDCERIERIMRRSALKRDKWDRRERPPGYLKTTILKAVALCGDVYNSGGATAKKLPPAQGDGPPPPASEVAGYQYMTVEQQQTYFKDCVYIGNIHAVWVKGYDFLKPDQFRTKFGGYDFAMDAIGNKTSDNAWKVFTESQAVKFPKVYGSCFRPKLRSGQIIVEEGRQLVNSYEPIKTKAIEGDVKPWLDWFSKVFPDDQDRRVLLCFMAACIQNPGVKFQWAPLIQGMQGNGKSMMITQVMAYCVGWRYTHLPKASDLGGNGMKFNGWMLNKLMIIIEEILTGAGDKNELSEALKPMITDTKYEIQQKGRDQMLCDNVANIIMMTNYKDAIRVTLDHRRYAILYMAQQSIHDLRRDGMTGDYFPMLRNWLYDKGGFEAINYYLKNLTIPEELNPATLCVRAPITSSTTEAVSLSLGAIEQEICDAMDEGRPGFAGGWVSSIKLNDLLNSLRVTGKVPQNKRRDMMRGIGYDWHPALQGGRVNNPIVQEGGKPKLFAQIDHINNNLGSCADVVKAYVKAQGYAPQFDGNVKAEA